MGENYIEYMKKYIRIDNVIETKNHFFFKVSNKAKLAHIIYDKTIDSAKHVKILDTKNFNTPIINDIDFCIDFWPSGIIDSNHLFSIVYAFELKEKVIENGSYNDFIKKNIKNTEVLRNVNITDNPILMIVRLK
jgi:hypothetical protein